MGSSGLGKSGGEGACGGGDGGDGCRDDVEDGDGCEGGRDDGNGGDDSGDGSGDGCSGGDSTGAGDSCGGSMGVGGVCKCSAGVGDSGGGSTGGGSAGGEGAGGSETGDAGGGSAGGEGAGGSTGDDGGSGGSLTCAGKQSGGGFDCGSEGDSTDEGGSNCGGLVSEGEGGCGRAACVVAGACMGTGGLKLATAEGRDAAGAASDGSAGGRRSSDRRPSQRARRAGKASGFPCGGGSIGSGGACHVVSSEGGDDGKLQPAVALGGEEQAGAAAVGSVSAWRPGSRRSCRRDWRRRSAAGTAVSAWLVGGPTLISLSQMYERTPCCLAPGCAGTEVDAGRFRMLGGRVGCMLWANSCSTPSSEVCAVESRFGEGTGGR